MTHWRRSPALQMPQGMQDHARPGSRAPISQMNKGRASRRAGEPRPSRKPLQTQGEEEGETEGCGPRRGGRGPGFLGVGRGPCLAGHSRATEPQNTLATPPGFPGVTGQELTRGRGRADTCL